MSIKVKNKARLKVTDIKFQSFAQLLSHVPENIYPVLSITREKESEIKRAFWFKNRRSSYLGHVCVFFVCSLLFVSFECLLFNLRLKPFKYQANVDMIV